MTRKHALLTIVAGCAAVMLLLLKRPASPHSDRFDATPTPSRTTYRPATGGSKPRSNLDQRSQPAADSSNVIPSNQRSAAAVEKRIAQYFRARDVDAWSRLRHELLDLAVPRDEAVRIAKSYLDHAEPLVRYAAADTLYRVGDRSGADALIKLVLTPSRIPVQGVDSDLRSWAAGTLAKYREIRARDAVAVLYFATKDLDVRTFAAELGARQIIPDLLEDMRRRVWKNQLEESAHLQLLEAKPIIVQQFQRESAPMDMKVAAADAMLRFGEEEPYLSYLLDIAGKYAASDLKSETRDLRIAGESAFRGLGLVQSARVQSFLEQALESANASVVQLALVQLRIKYPASLKARDRLLESINGRGGVDASTIFRLAALSTDNAIRSAAAERNGLLWQRAAVHERDWDQSVWLRNMGLE